MSYSLSYVKEYRQMPWIKRGMRLDMDGRYGRVTSGEPSGNIYVLFDGERRHSHIHPQWQTTYYDHEGQVIKDYKKREAR